MFWVDRTTKVTGGVLLLLVALVIAGAALQVASTGDADPMSRSDIESMLRDINSNQGVYFLGVSLNMFIDGVLMLFSGVLLYLIFHDRSRTLASLAAVGLVAAGLIAVVADTTSMALGLLAADFVKEGGPGGIAAGDPVILESARTLGAFVGLAEEVSSSGLAFGLLGLGVLLAWAPEGEVNPPRWMGSVGVLSAAGLLLGWLVTVDTATGIVVITVGYIATLVLLVSLGGWLLMRPEREPEMGGARPALA